MEPGFGGKGSGARSSCDLLRGFFCLALGKCLVDIMIIPVYYQFARITSPRAPGWYPVPHAPLERRCSMVDCGAVLVCGSLQDIP